MPGHVAHRGWLLELCTQAAKCFVGKNNCDYSQNYNTESSCIWWSGLTHRACNRDRNIGVSMQMYLMLSLVLLDVVPDPSICSAEADAWACTEMTPGRSEALMSFPPHPTPRVIYGYSPISHPVTGFSAVNKWFLCIRKNYNKEGCSFPFLKSVLNLHPHSLLEKDQAMILHC